MRRTSLNAIGGFFLAALLAVPVMGASPQVSPAQPGMINYVEGQVSIGTQALNMNSVGSAYLQAGQSLTTGNGKSEILLTPGVFLRVSDNSSVTMISPDLANTEVRLNRGRGMVEVAEIHKENNLLVDQNGSKTRLLKTGLYDFDANQDQVRVFDGEAKVQAGTRQIKLKGGRELNLSASTKAHKFDKDTYMDDFYRWASLRSDYLAEANIDAARSYSEQGSLWAGSGWYWDPWYGAYTFLPADGFFYSPFGWSYYSPTWVYQVPFAYYGHTMHRFDRGLNHVSRFRGSSPQYRSHDFGGGLRAGGGFHGGGRGFHGGGRRG